MIGTNSLANAAFVLTGTRFIYNEGDSNITIPVDNESDVAYGGQVWIDNSDEHQDAVYMIPAPSFFRIDKKGHQRVRVLNVNSDLPSEKESLFWLNVLEIPPKTEGEKNKLALAMNTRVKLIYRPTNIQQNRTNAEQEVYIEKNINQAYVVNPTPYYFAIVNIRKNGAAIEISNDAANDLAVFKPFSKVSVSPTHFVSDDALEFDAINDWGGVERYTF